MEGDAGLTTAQSTLYWLRSSLIILIVPNLLALDKKSFQRRKIFDLSYLKRQGSYFLKIIGGAAKEFQRKVTKTERVTI